MIHLRICAIPEHASVVNSLVEIPTIVGHSVRRVDDKQNLRTMFSLWQIGASAQKTKTSAV